MRQGRKNEDILLRSTTEEESVDTCTIYTDMGARESKSNHFHRSTKAHRWRNDADVFAHKNKNSLRRRNETLGKYLVIIKSSSDIYVISTIHPRSSIESKSSRFDIESSIS